MLMHDLQNVIQVFANLAVASAMGLCLIIGAAGTLQQRIAYDCGNCRASYATAKPQHVAALTQTHPAIKPVSMASIVD